MTAFNVQKIWSDERAIALQSTDASIDLGDFCREQRPFLVSQLKEHGALLLRGFAGSAENRIQEIVETFCGDTVDYVYGSTPRKRIAGKSFTATEYPAHLPIVMHTEMSYSRTWPRVLALQCLIAAESGGYTPIADMSKVSRDIGSELLEEFAMRRVRYVRNFGLGIDLSWQDSFQTRDRKEVERIARQQGIELQWLSESHLRSAQVCQGTISHPLTNEPIWFNQAHLFHVSNLPLTTRQSLEAMYSQDELPRNVTFGDGGAITDAKLDAVRAAFSAHSKQFDWKVGDVLVLDNLQYAHGRSPFSGKRLIAVAMGHELPDILAPPRSLKQRLGRLFSKS
jgi:alpha-ketoglutarate-dependent taurine dioxygenase